MSRTFLAGHLRRSSGPALTPICLSPIGHVRNGISEPQPHGWDKIESEIRLTVPGAADMLFGLGEYSHIYVVFWLDRLGQDRPRPLKLQPGGPSSPVQGVLATRSQLRPNPIGVSVAPLTSIEGNVVRVLGLDAVDGTPVLDLKPYVPYYDSVETARVPRWILGDGV